MVPVPTGNLSSMQPHAERLQSKLKQSRLAPQPSSLAAAWQQQHEHGQHCIAGWLLTVYCEFTSRRPALR